MLTNFQNFFTDRYNSKYATKWSLIIAHHILNVSLHQYRKTSEHLKHASLSRTNHEVVWLRLWCVVGHFTKDLLLSLLVKQFSKSVNTCQSYRQNVTNHPLIICKSILLQYLFFCVAADAYCHTVGILVWPLCLSFSQ